MRDIIEKTIEICKYDELKEHIKSEVEALKRTGPVAVFNNKNRNIITNLDNKDILLIQTLVDVAETNLYGSFIVKVDSLNIKELSSNIDVSEEEIIKRIGSFSNKKYIIVGENSSKTTLVLSEQKGIIENNEMLITELIISNEILDIL